jgi:transcriptional regulator with XRE-family HTH domain
MKRTSIYSQEHQQIIDLLKELRLKVGLSQAEVAEQLHRPQTYVSVIEIGRRGVDLLQVKELSEIYGWTLGQFVKEIEKRWAHPAQRPKRQKRPDAGRPRK